MLSNIPMIKKNLHLHSPIDRPLIDPQLPWYSAVDCWLIIISYPKPIACSHQPITWYSVVVTGLLLYNLPLIFEKNPYTSTPQLIDPLLILNYPGILLLIIDWFKSLTLDLFLPSTRFLVFWCRHWYFSIKYYSDFRKFSLQLYPTIDIPLIDTQLPWYSVVDCQLIRISDPRFISPTDPAPGNFLSSMVFCY